MQEEVDGGSMSESFSPLGDLLVQAMQLKGRSSDPLVQAMQLKARSSADKPSGGVRFRDEERSPVSLSLPSLASVSGAVNLPSYQTSRSAQAGFLRHTNSGGTALTSAPDGVRGGESARRSSAVILEPLGPGYRGLASAASTMLEDKHVQRVEDVLSFAKSMGMSRQAPAMKAKAMQASRRSDLSQQLAVQPRISSNGVQLSVLIKLAESISITPELTTAQVVSRVVVPNTAQQRCRYIDTLPDKLVGPPSLYVVHCWGLEFLALVKALQRHLELTRAPADTYLWIDFFCRNQHYETGSAEMAGACQVLGSVDKVVLVLDAQGVALSRTWVLYELWKTSSLSDRLDRLVVLPVSWIWTEMGLAFGAVSVASSQASRGPDRASMVKEMGQHDSQMVVSQVKDAMLIGSKREMLRAETLASVNPQRYIDAATATALLLYQGNRFSEAEDVMTSIKNVIGRSRELTTAEDEACYLLHLALIVRDKGLTSDAERLMQTFTSVLKEKPSPLYLSGLSVLVDLLCSLKLYTKAELLCRKMIELRQAISGTMCNELVADRLQMASISMAQSIFEEAEGHVQGALEMATQLGGPVSAHCGSCHHLLAMCSFYSNRFEEAWSRLGRALEIREALLGPSHPSTLESKSIKAMLLVSEHSLEEAEALVGSILSSRLAAYGIEHVDTLETLGCLADLLRRMERAEQSAAAEKRLLDTGKTLLQYKRIDKFRSLQFISSFLYKRPHLLEKAALFLAKAYVTYKEKLGADADITLSTKQQLLEIIEQQLHMAAESLENAQLFDRPAEFQMAEVTYKQAWSTAKLVQPERDHKEIARGLADALFGQGKVQDAKSVLRIAGLVKKGMKNAMPASYLRWLNRRVENYMDAKNDMLAEDDDDDRDEAG